MGIDGFARDVMPCTFVHLARPLPRCRETLPCRPSGSNWRRIGRSPNCRNVESHRLGANGHLTLEQMKLSPGRTKARLRLWKAARENKEPAASPCHGGCRDGKKGRGSRQRRGSKEMSMATIVGIQAGVALRNSGSSQTCIRRVFHDHTETATTMCYPSPVVVFWDGSGDG